MKTKYAKLIPLVVVLAVVAGLVSLMATPALACSNGDMEFYPTKGPVGTVVTVYYWSGQGHIGEWENPYLYDLQIDNEILWGLEPNSTTFGGIPLSHEGIIDEMGQFTFAVPNVPLGDYLITIKDHYGFSTDVVFSSGQHSIFTVTPGPVVRNPSTIVGHTLERLDGKYETVWGLDPASQTWKVYEVAKPAQPFNNLKALEKGQTIWIKVTEDDVVLNWHGTLYFLGKGWNLITGLGDTYGIGNVTTVPAMGDQV